MRERDRERGERMQETMREGERMYVERKKAIQKKKPRSSGVVRGELYVTMLLSIDLSTLLLSNSHGHERITNLHSIVRSRSIHRPTDVEREKVL